MAERTRQTPPAQLLLLLSALAVVVAEQRLSPAADDAAVADDDEVGSVQLVPATFAAGDWHVAEGRLGCMRGVHRTVVGHTSVNKRQPEGPHDTLYIGDEVESVRVWYDPRVGTYKELLELFWKIVDDPTHVVPGPLGPKQWQSALFWHNEEQRQLATASLSEVRMRYDKRRGDGGGGDGDASFSSSSSSHSHTAGDSHPVKTLAMRAGSYFEPAPVSEQKAELQRRDELKEPFKGNLSSDAWILESQTAAKLNGYLSGGCMSRQWPEVESELVSLNLTFPQLESLGLEHLFPGVIVLPPFGAREEMEAKEKEARRRRRRGRGRGGRPTSLREDGVGEAEDGVGDVGESSDRGELGGAKDEVDGEAAGARGSSSGASARRPRRERRGRRKGEAEDDADDGKRGGGRAGDDSSSGVRDEL